MFAQNSSSAHKNLTHSAQFPKITQNDFEDSQTFEKDKLSTQKDFPSIKMFVSSRDERSTKFNKEMVLFVCMTTVIYALLAPD